LNLSVVSFPTLIFPKPPLCALKTNRNVLSMKYSLNWFSTFSALVHLDCESPKVPCYCGSWRVRRAIRTFWHNLPPFKVIGKITIYHFHNAFASKSQVLLAMRARCHRILAIGSVLYFSQSDYSLNSMSFLRSRKDISPRFCVSTSEVD
jgi:hypothetical protein